MIAPHERKTPPAANRLRGRSVFGALSIVLLLVQMLLVASATGPRLAGGDAAQAHATAICASTAHDGGSPQEGRDHPYCCSFCQASARGVAAGLEPSAYSALHARASAALPPFVAAPARRRPVGWTSSWSSRAPPSFS